MKHNEAFIPVAVLTSEASNKEERSVRKKLSKAIKNGAGTFKVRTSSGAFNEFFNPFTGKTT